MQNPKEADLFAREELQKAHRAHRPQVICSKMQMPEAFEMLYVPSLFFKVHRIIQPMSLFLL